MKSNGSQPTICKRCVMDVTDADIVFFDDGTCSNCRLYELRQNQSLANRLTAQQIVDRIKSDESKFDCVIGLSGGVDSSYLALLAKKIGLRPLAIHVDNGWNTPEAIKNIENLVTTLDLDFKTYVLDWQEFRLIQRSFVQASVINIEIPTDHAINAVLFKEAEKHNVRTILSGSNLATEAILPKSYGGYDSFDWAHIKGVTEQISGVNRLPLFPKLTLYDWFRLTVMKSIKFFPILNHFDYDKEFAIKRLEQEVSWTRYEGKHCESTFTKFFQSYILPEKFNIDKRKAHFSSMIMSKMMTRQNALNELAKPAYQTAKELQKDQFYFCKKLGFSEKEFLRSMKQKPVSHEDFPSNRQLIHNTRFLIRRIRSKTIKL